MKDFAASNIQINFKEVCYSCKHRNTYINEHNLYGDNIVFVVATVIGCEHEKVCKCYLENE